MNVPQSSCGHGFSPHKGSTDQSSLSIAHGRSQATYTERTWKMKSYLAQHLILKEPACIGYFQRISNVYCRTLCCNQILTQHCIQGRMAIALGHTHLQGQNQSTISLVQASYIPIHSPLIFFLKQRHTNKQVTSLEVSHSKVSNLARNQGA